MYLSDLSTVTVRTPCSGAHSVRRAPTARRARADSIPEQPNEPPAVREQDPGSPESIDYPRVAPRSVRFGRSRTMLDNRDVNDAVRPADPTPPASSSTTDGTGPRTRPRTGSRLYPRVTSFRSRRGALTPNQQKSWDRTWPLIGREVADEPLDADTWFGRPAPLVIEIGCGTGTATAEMAQAEPHLNLIGIEVYQPGLAQLVQRIERDEIGNIRLLRGDAVD